MTTYVLIRFVHVLTAVLAMGLVTAGVILSRASSGVPAIALRPLVRGAAAGIGLLIVSGLVLDYLVAGAFHRATWFRAGGALAIGSGVAVGISRGAIARAIAGQLGADQARRRVSLALGFALAFIVAAVTAMVLRP